MSTLARFFTWMLLLFQTQEPPVQPVEPAPAPPPPPSEPLPEPSPEPESIKPLAARAVPKPKPSDAYGQFFFREQILDQLDDYFRIVKRMRQADAEAYALYSRIGAHVMPYSHRLFATTDPNVRWEWDMPKAERWERLELSPWWKTHRPAFGAVALIHPQNVQEERLGRLGKNAQHKEISLTPRFVYFIKYNVKHKYPANVQRMTGADLYLVTFYWENTWMKKEGDIPCECAIAIDPAGTITVLNRRMHTERMVRPRHGGNSFSVPDHHWGVPQIYEDWATNHGIPVREHLRNMFIGATSTYEAAQYSMIRIDVRKSGIHAVFGVDVRRTPYFFRDREVILGKTGHRKPIFHIVKGHQRESGAFVKTHFRGEKHFAWNGYDVRISVPGRDHLHIAEFDVGALESTRDERKARNLMGQGEIGRVWQQHMQTGKRLRDILDERKSAE